MSAPATVPAALNAQNVGQVLELLDRLAPLTPHLADLERVVSLARAAFGEYEPRFAPGPPAAPTDLERFVATVQLLRHELVRVHHHGLN